MWMLRDDSPVVKLLLRVPDDTLELKILCFHSILLKKRLLWANMMFSCLYILLLIFVYVMLMKVRPITASWNILTHTGLLVLPGTERQNSVIPCLGFCSPGIATHILSALWFFCHEYGWILTRLPSKVVSSPTLLILRSWLDMTPSNLLWLDLLWAGNWNTWPPEVPSYLQLSMILQFHDCKGGE